MNTPTEVMWRAPVTAYVPGDWAERAAFIERYIVQSSPYGADPWDAARRAAGYWDLNRKRDR